MRIPSVTVVVHAENGRIKSSCASDVASGAIRHIVESWGFDFLMLWLGRYCLYMAAEHSLDEDAAEIWIARYRSLYGIK